MSHLVRNYNESWPPHYLNAGKSKLWNERNWKTTLKKTLEPSQSKPLLQISGCNSLANLGRRYEDKYGGRSSPVKILDRNEFTDSSYATSSIVSCASHQSNSEKKGIAEKQTRGTFSIDSSSSLGTNKWLNPADPDVVPLKKWHSLTQLSQRPLSPASAMSDREMRSTTDHELRIALEESSLRRTELVKRLREAYGRLEGQEDQLRTRDDQLENNKVKIELMVLKQKQLEMAVNSLEQEKEMLELSRFEESRRGEDLQRKIQQLELEMLKVKTVLERNSVSSSPLYNSALNSRLITNGEINGFFSRTHDDFFRQEKKKEKEKEKEKVERELHDALEDLSKSQDRIRILEAEKERMMDQLKIAKQQRYIQNNEKNKMLRGSVQAQDSLQDELNDLRTDFSNVSLEKELLSSKVVRLEENVTDLKLKLAAAVADKDRFMQEKLQLHKRVKELEMELQRAQMGREGFTDQVCDLHIELVDAKAQANRQDQEKIMMKEELVTVKQVNEHISADLADTKQKLEIVLKQLHELEAEKVIHINQITALEKERCQLIEEKEVLMTATMGTEEVCEDKMQKLKEECQALRDSEERLLKEQEHLQACCKELRTELGVKNEELHQKEEEFLHQIEEQQTVAQHWKERWQEAALSLKTKDEDKISEKEETKQLGEELERLQSIVQSNQDEIQNLLQEKAKAESELQKCKESSSIKKIQLDACKQQLELERSHSQSLQQRLNSNICKSCKMTRSPSEVGISDHGLKYSSSVEGMEDLHGEKAAQEFLGMNEPPNSKNVETISMQVPATEEMMAEINTLNVQLVEASAVQKTQQDEIQSLREELEELKLKKSGDLNASLDEVDSELFQVREELQKVWDMLKVRDSEFEEQQQELQLIREQFSECNSEMMKIKQELNICRQQLAHRDRMLEEIKEKQKAAMDKTVVLETQQTKGVLESSTCPPCHDLEKITSQVEDLRKQYSEQKREKDKTMEASGPSQMKSLCGEHSPMKKDFTTQNNTYEKQHQLVTEQLKTLFKEREQLGKAYNKLSGAWKGKAPLEGWVNKSQIIQNAVDTIHYQERKKQELEEENERLKGTPNFREYTELQEKVKKLQNELQHKSNKMSSMSNEIENLKGRNENVIKMREKLQQQISDIRETGQQTRRKEAPKVSTESGRSQQTTKLVEEFNRDPSLPVHSSTLHTEEEEGVGHLGDESVHFAKYADSCITSGSSRSSTPVYLETPSLSDTHSLVTSPAAKMFLSTQTSDVSPLTPRSWGGSQESLTDKHSLLLSPKPYKGQFPKKQN
ncbi:trichohyalin-like [Polypterus senegalus]|uniref:trichohyalin-like n=1 Tax=Polypterus senegalus TaxID=55291 RepID=UPI00196298EF|nr:trichohyalin-like [Polypterus senegalus]XP_039629107.1 trichohyalin-like [Polypterus senegalus]XP_039629108.1 trichohyalin-like [Polypterus senegalus]